jgi:hypothetical protein
VTGVFERAAGFFLTPATHRAATARAETAGVPPAARAVVLGAAADAVPLAAALALSPRLDGGGPALVATWPPDAAAGPAGATRAAARLATRLSARDLPAAARGRLAWLALPGEPAAATAAVRRASAVVEGPLVAALCGPRPPELDGLVAEHDLAVVAAAPDTPLARAAVAQLTAAGVVACACAPLSRGLPRALAMAGVAGPRLAALRAPAASGEGGR